MHSSQRRVAKKGNCTDVGALPKGKVWLRVSVAALVAVAAGCGADAPPPPAPAAVEAPARSARPSGRGAFRPKYTFSDGRDVLAGVAFVVEGATPIGVTASHVILGIRKNASLSKLELVDAATRERLAEATGLALPPGAPMDGLDFSTDFAFVRLDRVPDGTARFALSTERPTVGDAVEIVACPADGSAPEVVLAGSLLVVDTNRLEVLIEGAGGARGFAGAPIVDPKSGRVVGVLQTVTPGSGQALGRATPAAHVAARLATIAQDSPALPLTTWK